MARALGAWLGADGDRVGRCARAAEALAETPWDAVRHAGLLARARVSTSDQDLGLGEDLSLMPPDAAAAVARVEAGQPFPLLVRRERRRSGAFDTPPAMARGLAERALAICAPRRALDPACGAGALLLALAERGVPELHGADRDPAAVAVARVVLPQAKIEVRDAFEGVAPIDLLIANPPFVSPEAQDKAQRAALRERYPWLSGRFDLAVPFLAAALEDQPAGGLAAFILPTPLLSQPYATPLRRRWLERHAVASLSAPSRFPGAGVEVSELLMVLGGGPARMPWALGPRAEALLSLDNAPLDPRVQHGDVALVAQVRARSFPLGALCEVDTGLVAHGPGGGKARLLREEPGPGCVPYADARSFFAGRRAWLEYAPERMHRPKRPSLFEGEKILIQRLRGEGRVRAEIDRSGLYAGHTLTVVRPRAAAVPIERLLALLRSALTAGLMRVECGGRLDLYPKVVRDLPVPTSWRASPGLGLAEAWGLDAAQARRLHALGGGAGSPGADYI